MKVWRGGGGIAPLILNIGTGQDGWSASYADHLTSGEAFYHLGGGADLKHVYFGSLNTDMCPI